MKVNGEIIRKEMRKRDIRVTELARMLGCSHSSVSKWIYGR
ncbi:MAG: helix-turn-helix transcriptional regulator [Clostridia bacterium]|nr:helix-turn-helix transcriptional regulator [Clostridia bacterium]